LLYALDKCGRRDIKEEVEEILNRRPHWRCSSSISRDWVFL
jgi:hypothetical protein